MSCIGEGEVESSCGSEDADDKVAKRLIQLAFQLLGRPVKASKCRKNLYYFYNGPWVALGGDVRGDIRKVQRKYPLDMGSRKTGCCLFCYSILPEDKLVSWDGPISNTNCSSLFLSDLFTTLSKHQSSFGPSENWSIEGQCSLCEICLSACEQLVSKQRTVLKLQRQVLQLCQKLFAVIKLSRIITDQETGTLGNADACTLQENDLSESSTESSCGEGVILEKSSVDKMGDDIVDDEINRHSSKLEMEQMTVIPKSHPQETRSSFHVEELVVPNQVPSSIPTDLLDTTGRTGNTGCSKDQIVASSDDSTSRGSKDATETKRCSTVLTVPDIPPSSPSSLVDEDDAFEDDGSSFSSDASSSSSDSEEDSQDQGEPSPIPCKWPILGEFKRTKIHRCDFCNKVLETPSKLNLHLLKHTGERPQACHLCDKRYATVQSLRFHLVKKHPEVEPPKISFQTCVHCHKIFHSPSVLKKHLKSHIGERPHACHLCDKRYSLASTLNFHLVRDHQEVNENIKTYKCTHCNRIFNYPAGLKAHLRTHTGERPYACHVCEKRYSMPEALNHHLGRMHSEETQIKLKVYQCVHCHKVLASASCLKIHLRRHTGERPYACHLCEKRLPAASALNQHLKSRHPEEMPANPFKCDICAANLFSQKALSHHKQVKHLGIRKYACERCGKRFGKEHELVQHYYTHSKDRPFLCQKCPLTFTCKIRLNSHIKRMHEGPMECSYCCKRFKNEPNLVKHMRIHTEKGPYSCKQCGKNFTKNRNMLMHVRKKHDRATGAK